MGFVRLILSLAVLALASSACAMERAWIHGVASGGGGTSPRVIPGTDQPLYTDTGSSNALLALTSTNADYAVPSLSPTNHGSSGDNGYNIRGWAEWDAVPLQFISGCHQIGILPFHMPTNAEKAVGTYNNINDIKVRTDKGSWFTITGPSVNNDAGGQIDWNFTVCDSDYANDGLHSAEEIIEPTTGPDIIMQGPLMDYPGNGYQIEKVTGAYFDNGTRGTTGHIMTIPTGVVFYNYTGGTLSTSYIGYGQSVTAQGIAPGVWIDGDGNKNATACFAETGANCNGTGGTGTYHLTGPSEMLDTVMTGSISNGAGGSGNTMTVTAISNGIVGKDVPVIFGAGVVAGTRLDSDGRGGVNTGNCQPGPTACTGTSLLGTYYLNTANNVGSEALYGTVSATFNDMSAFYFVTNHGGGIKRPTVWVCEGTCNGVTGSNSNSGTTSSAPFATLLKAMTIAPSQDNTTTYHHGKWGEVICLMSTGSTLTFNGTSAGIPDSGLGYTVFEGAWGPDCGLGTDPQTAVLNNNPILTNRSYWYRHDQWDHIAIQGPPSNFSGGDAAYWVVSHVTETGDTQYASGLNGAGGYACLESTVYFPDNICASAQLVRGTTGNFIISDCFHDTRVIFANTCANGGYPGGWMTATYHTGTPLTPTNITVTDPALSGYTLAQIIAVNNGTYDMWDSANPTHACLTDSPTVASVGTTSITFNNTVGDAGTCADGSTVYLAPINSHPDGFQFGGGDVWHNVIVMNNNIGTVAGSGTGTKGAGGQGAFPEDQQMDGFALVGNYFKLNPAGFTMENENGGNNNLIYYNNSWMSSNSFTHNRYSGDNNSTLLKDACTTAGTWMIPGQTTSNQTNMRTLQATTNYCYTTTTP